DGGLEQESDGQPDGCRSQPSSLLGSRRPTQGVDEERGGPEASEHPRRLSDVGVTPEEPKPERRQDDHDDEERPLRLATPLIQASDSEQQAGPGRDADNERQQEPQPSNAEVLIEPNLR